MMSPKQEAVAYNQYWNEPHLFKMQGAETFAELQQRIVTTVKTIVAKYHQRQVLIVSHGVILKSFLCYIQKRPLSEVWAPPRLHNCAHSIVESE